jgi:hypothetical protein
VPFTQESDDLVISTTSQCGFGWPGVVGCHPFERVSGGSRRARAGAQVAEFDRTLLGDAFEFGLLGNTFVWFIRALDAIQPFVALGWKQLRYFIDTAGSGGLASEASDAVGILDGLADLEPMFAQLALYVASDSDAGLYHEIEVSMSFVGTFREAC